MNKKIILIFGISLFAVFGIIFLINKVSADSPQVSRIGSAKIQDIGLSNTGSNTTFYVPVGTDYITVGVTGWGGGSTTYDNFYSSGTITLNGSAFSVISSADANGDLDLSALFGYKNPASGIYTLAWDWKGTASSVDHSYIVFGFYKGVDQTNPIRASGSQQGGASGSVTTGLMSGVTGDMAVALLEAEDASITWVNATAIITNATHIYYGEANLTGSITISEASVQYGALSGVVLAGASGTANCWSYTSATKTYYIPKGCTCYISGSTPLFDLTNAYCWSG